MNSKCVVVAAVIEKRGRFLICQRPEHKRHGRLWEFPGGKIEPGEDIAAAATRELSEELGVKAVKVGTVMFIAEDPGSNFVVYFVKVAISGEPVALEHEALAWLTGPELLKMPLAPSDRLFAFQLS